MERTDPRPPLPRDAARDALYSGPLADFMDLRARLAASLKASGQKDAAKAVLALRKPSAAAWALNQLARRRPDDLAGLYEARAKAEQAQSSGDREALRSAIAAYRTRLDAVVATLDDYLVETGSGSTRELVRRMRATVDAAARDAKGLGAELAVACLVQPFSDEDLEKISEPSSTGGGVASATRGPVAAPGGSDVVELAARRLREHARRRLDERRAELAECEVRADVARARLAEASETHEIAARALLAARERTEEAERDLQLMEPGPARLRPQG